MKKLIIGLLTLVYAVSGFGQGSGHALEFDGTSSYVACDTVNLGGSALTLSAWVKADAFKTTFPYISSIMGTETSGNTALLRTGDASLAADIPQFVLQIGTAQVKLAATTSLNTGEWYHLTATYDGSSMKIYINGQLDASMSQTGSVTSNLDFAIGRNYGNDRILDGQLDEVRVWRTALSQSAIRDWMCKSVDASHPNYNSLEAYYKVDAGTGASVTDHSPNGHHGNFAGAPLWQTSGVPLGDESVHDFSSPFQVALPHSDGDTLSVSSVTGSPEAVYLYRVNGLPNTTSGVPGQVGKLDSTRYWGVFFVGGASPNGTVSYDYSGNSTVASTDLCLLELLVRDDNTDNTWSSSSASIQGNTFVKSNSGSQEFLLGFAGSSSIHPSGSQSICHGDSVKLQHNTSGLSYQWLYNNNPVSGSTNTFYASQSGTYQLVYSVSSCTDSTNLFTLSVDTIPSVSFSAIDPVCSSKSTDTITGGVPTGGIYQGTYISSGNIFNINASGPGDHVITYKFTDANGCGNAAQQTFHVKPIPNVNLTSLSALCIDDTAFALANGTPAGGTYRVNGTAQSTIDPQNFGTGLHKVKYHFTDTNNCSASDSTGLIIRDLPTVSFGITKAGMCEGDSPVNLSSGTPSGGTYTGNGVVGNKFNSVVAGVGVHTVTYEYTDGNGCSNEASDSIEVYYSPPKPTLSQSNDTLYSMPPSDIYHWYNWNNQLLSVQTQYIIPSANGFYYVVHETSNGCVSEASEQFAYQYDGPIDNIDETPGPDLFRVYPNPAKGAFQVEYRGREEAVLKVRNIHGRAVVEQKVYPHSVIGLELPAGQYVLELAGDRQSTVQKFLIR